MLRYRAPKLLAIGLLLCLATACPSSSDLDRMAKASNELAHDVLIANRVVAEFYKAGKISLPAKDTIARELGIIGTKGEAFNNLLIELDKKYPQGTLPPQDLSLVRQNLSELRRLYAAVFADLLPFHAGEAVKNLDTHLTTLEKGVK